MKYKKKPVTIEAIQYIDELSVIQMVNAWGESFREATSVWDDGSLAIRTLEGIHVASKADYIIKGVKGEFYPCKPDIFNLTYEVV